MAQISADAARPVQKQQARRPVSRIVPAIPLRLSRRAPAAKPAVVESLHKNPVVPQQEAEPPAQQPVHEVEKKKVEEAAQSVETPVVPDIKTVATQPESETGVGAEAAALASSPAKSQDEEVQQVVEYDGEN